MDAESSRYGNQESILHDRSLKPHSLSLQYLVKITNNFSDERILGKGGFGVVYLGMLEDREKVAVKKLRQSITVQEKQFQNEVDLLMRLKHTNIVRLLGYCYEIQKSYKDYEGKFVFAENIETLLCLEYLPKNSLHTYLSEKSPQLHNWHTCYKIIEGICHGLHYLHLEISEPIIHLDLKPANILLDDNMVPKITDFGLSRLHQQQTIYTNIANGTPGYMPPEYIKGGVITPMSDIFSLGVVIIEVIAGHRDYPDVVAISEAFVELELQRWRNMLQKAPQASLEMDCEQIKRCIQIGLFCVNPKRIKRPTTERIINMLDVVESTISFSEWLESIDCHVSNETTSTRAQALNAIVASPATISVDHLESVLPKPLNMGDASQRYEQVSQKIASRPCSLQSSPKLIKIARNNDNNLAEAGNMYMPTMGASASTGVMNSLLRKLNILMGNEYRKLGMQSKVASLWEELSSMNALLVKLVAMDELDVQAREWGDQVRDMSYDIEDCIDDFMHHLEEKGATTGFFNTIIESLTKLMVRYQIANKIQGIEARIIKVNDRRKWYKLDEYTPSFRIVLVDPRALAIYAEASGLVGIDVPRDELVELLMDKDQELKVTSIVGFGGLGKTTLAGEVCRMIQRQFTFDAFVSVSLKPDISRLLQNLLLKLTGRQSAQCSNLDDVIRNIREYLVNERYFIIVDDLWDSSAWETIKCAFPENSHGSRVLTTTRINSIAAACCSKSRACVYQMKSLNDQDSRRLFFNRIFGSGEPCPGELEDVSTDI